MAEELSDMLKNFSLMSEEVKGIAIDNAFCSRDGKEKKSLSSWESYDGSDNGQGHDLLKCVAADVETNWDGDIQIVRYKLVPHIVRYDWV